MDKNIREARPQRDWQVNLKKDFCGDFFSFKVFLPIYSPLQQFMLDENAYADKGINCDFKKFVAEEKTINS